MSGKRETYSRDAIGSIARDMRRKTGMTQTQAEARVKSALREQDNKQANGNK